jgi:hypothetical protein
MSQESTVPDSNVKTVTVTGEAAEFLEPKKTRKNRKNTLITNDTVETTTPNVSLKPNKFENSSENSNNTANNIINNIQSIPVAQGTFDSSSKSILPKNLVSPVILTRKNKVINHNQTNQLEKKMKPVLKVPVKSEIKQEEKKEQKKEEKKPEIKQEDKKEEKKEEKKLEIKQEEKKEETKTRKHKFGGRRISISIAESDPKTRKARKNIKHKVKSMSIEEIREKLAKDGLINKENRKIPEIMLRNMMKDSLLLASGK